jgi:hypothetical protein
MNNLNNLIDLSKKASFVRKRCHEIRQMFYSNRFQEYDEIAERRFNSEKIISKNYKLNMFVITKRFEELRQYHGEINHNILKKLESFVTKHEKALDRVEAYFRENNAPIYLIASECEENQTVKLLNEQKEYQLQIILCDSEEEFKKILQNVRELNQNNCNDLVNFKRENMDKLSKTGFNKKF